jgi:hypothetical protein
MKNNGTNGTNYLIFYFVFVVPIVLMAAPLLITAISK